MGSCACIITFQFLPLVSFFSFDFLCLIYHRKATIFNGCFFAILVFSSALVLNLAFLLPLYLQVSSLTMLMISDSYLRPGGLWDFPTKLSRMYTLLCTYVHSLIKSLAPVNSLAWCPWNLFLHFTPLQHWPNSGAVISIILWILIRSLLCASYHERYGGCGGE